jgi:hypothetical protein
MDAAILALSPPQGSLEMKLVGDITGRFFVARYQRGYRWGVQEVRALLNDLWTSQGKPYSLQPVVVKRRSEDEWELIDGQQRLTTLYLIVRYMEREGLQREGPLYTLHYETRPGSEAYLQHVDAALSGTNIDYFHIHGAYQCIRAWFEVHGPRRQYVANKLYGFLFESVRVIWYDAPSGVDATDLFTRLNVGRIPLTDAELVKALLLSRCPEHRKHEIAAQWDAIERDLRQPDVWAFVADTPQEELPTRINLLLDTIAGGPQGRLRPRYYTFDTVRQRIEGSSPQQVWDEVLDLHALVMGWFENPDLYHKIGYLVAVGDRFADLVHLAKGSAKKSFEEALDARIRARLDLSQSDLAALDYESPARRQKCEWVLLLMNVETTRRLKAGERYPFRLHHEERWSLEHIHAQQAEGLNRVEQWREWLELHRNALADMPSIDAVRRDALVKRIDASMDTIDRHRFDDLAREVTTLFTSTQESGQTHGVHSISNLALLSSGANSALGNAVFEVKRRRILKMDRDGEYIPICTRRVFLKYYTEADAQQIHFWGAQDRESYLGAMIGVVARYLKPEERT